MQTLTELEDQLWADANGAFLQTCQTQLMAEVSRLSHLQRQLQSPQSYASLERQRLACLAAIRVIQRVWMTAQR